MLNITKKEAEMNKSTLKNFEKGLEELRQRELTLRSLTPDQRRSFELCEKFGYHRVGGFDKQTGLAWACWKPRGEMFHIYTTGGKPAYNHTFPEVSEFRHKRAVVHDGVGWRFHIKPDGTPAYEKRFVSV